MLNSVHQNYTLHLTLCTYTLQCIVTRDNTVTKIVEIHENFSKKLNVYDKMQLFV